MQEVLVSLSPQPDRNPSGARRSARELGSQFVAAVRANGAEVPALFDRIVDLPGVSAAHLAGAALELCSNGGRRGDPAQLCREQVHGARLVLHCGLFFDEEIVNKKLVPLLLQVPAPRGVESDDLWKLRLPRIMALCQIAPKLPEESVDQALRAAVMHARIGKQMHTNLFMPLAGFEEAFRSRSFEQDVDLRRAARMFCLDSISQHLDLTVQALAEATPESFSRSMQILPWTMNSAVSLLTLMPSVASEGDQKTAETLGQVLEGLEWLLRRPVGFPGNFFGAESAQRFESLRSLLSLATGVLVVGDERHLARVREMQIRCLDDAPFLGVAFLHSILKNGVNPTVGRFQGIIESLLPSIAEPNDLHGQEGIEIAALAWHLGVGSGSQLSSALEHARNPSTQLLLMKALNDDDPWNRRG